MFDQAPASCLSPEALRVLIVDDNEDSARTLGWAIEAEGHAVTVCLDGQSALDKVGSLRPDVILLDLGMPGMNGLEVARALRADPATRDVRIVAQTGWSDPSARQRTAETGFDLHLVKPVNLTVLNDMLAMLAASRPRTVEAA